MLSITQQQQFANVDYDNLFSKRFFNLEESFVKPATTCDLHENTVKREACIALQRTMSLSKASIPGVISTATPHFLDIVSAQKDQVLDLGKGVSNFLSNRGKQHLRSIRDSIIEASDNLYKNSYYMSFQEQPEFTQKQTPTKQTVTRRR